MKKSVFILMLILVLTLPSSVFAGYQSMQELFYTVQINADGSADVLEEWHVYVYDTNTLFKTFEPDSSKYSGISNIEVYDITNGEIIPFYDVGEWQYHVDENGYYGEMYDGNFEIGWYAGLDGGRNGRKIYQIQYTIDDVILRGNDYSEFYWQFIGETNGMEVLEIQGEIYLPANASSKDDIKVWGHTPSLNGEIHATDLNKVSFSGEYLEPENMFEVRVLFPSSMVEENIARTKDGDILDSVIKEETKWANTANAKREVAKAIVNAPKYIYYICVFWGLFNVIKLIAKNIRINNFAKEKYKPTQKLDYYREFPSDDTNPIEANMLIKNNGREIENKDFGNAFSAILLDMVRQGIITVTENDSLEKDKRIEFDIVSDYSGKYSKSEETVIEFLKKVSASYDKITPDTIEKTMKEYYKSTLNLKDDLSMIARSRLKQKKLFTGRKKEAHELKRGCLYATLPILALIFLGYAADISDTGAAYLFWLFVAMFVEGILRKKALKSISEFTKAGIDAQEEWKAFKRYMEEYSLLHEREVKEVALWEKYLVYATAFGTAKKVLKQIEVQLPEVYTSLTANNAVMISMVDLDLSRSYSRGYSSAQNTKRAVEAAASSSYSSGSGGGGGFSDGGGDRRRRWRHGRSLNHE